MPQRPLSFNSQSPTGGLAPNKVGYSGDLLSSQLHGSKYNLALSAGLFSGANQAGATLSAALATTYTGLCLSNPAGNTKNLAVRRVSAGIIVAPAAFLALGLITGYAAGGITAHTTPITVLRNMLINGAAATAKLDAACTLVGTPAWQAWLASSAATGGNVSVSQDYEGGLIIPPGGYVAIGAQAAGPASGFVGSIEWEEVAIPA